MSWCGEWTLVAGFRMGRLLIEGSPGTVILKDIDPLLNVSSPWWRTPRTCAAAVSATSSSTTMPQLATGSTPVAAPKKSER